MQPVLVDRAEFEELKGTTIALEKEAGVPVDELEAAPPEVLCLGAERTGLPAVVLSAAGCTAHIPARPDGPDSLNVGMAAAIALYARNRMAARG